MAWHSKRFIDKSIEKSFDTKPIQNRKKNRKILPQTSEDKGFEVGLRFKLEWVENRKLPKVILEIFGRRVRLF